MNVPRTPPRPLESHLEAPLQFTFITTGDGSPTVRLGLGEGCSEAMHSHRGAFAETQYIYGEAIEQAYQSGFQPRVLSLGLGLGYVEILSAGLALKFAKSLQDISAGDTTQTEISSNFLSQVGGESFEFFPDLRIWFTDWACESGEVPATFVATYNLILDFTSRKVGIPGREIQLFLKELISSKRWLLRPSLESSTSFENGRFGVICFDAFSSKTSPELWCEDFLRDFFDKTFAQQSILSTYACTSALKRTLVECGFTVNIRAGFAGKRPRHLPCEIRDKSKLFDLREPRSRPIVSYAIEDKVAKSQLRKIHSNDLGHDLDWFDRDLGNSHIRF